MTEQTLTEIVTGLEPLLIERLSRIRITWDGTGATATFAFSLRVQAGKGSRVRGYEIEVDTDDMPEGVSLTGWACYPDLVRPLSLSPDVETQIRELNGSGLVGTLDASRYSTGAEGVRRGHPATSWVISTHAGSDEERRAWVRRINGWGGKRPGSGKPRLADECVKSMTVTLTPSDRAALEEIGDGNASAGIRELLRRHRELTP